MTSQQIKQIVCFICVVIWGVFFGTPTLDEHGFNLVTNLPQSVEAAAPAKATNQTARIFLPLVLTSSAQNVGATWSMVAANPQRTSWTPEEVRGNLNLEWYRPIEPYIPYKIQPIAANGKIYVSTARGLYAINATNGNVDWIYPTELPLGNAPTIANLDGRVIAYVGGYDHKIHAIDANTGQDIAGYMAYEGAAGFETNPLIISDSYTGNASVIFAGNRDGYFYALDATTGSLKWRYQTAGSITYSAAYKNGVVYFASNDMYAYALNASNGSLRWKSQKLQGQSFHSYWPVVYTNKSTGKDYVIFTGGESYRQDELSLPTSENPLGETAILYKTSGDLVPSGSLIDYPSSPGSVPGDWAPGTVTMDARRIESYLENYPYRHFVFVLDAGTGQEFTFDSNGNGKPEFAPFVWSGVTSSGNKFPPVINGVDGVYYQDTTYYSGGWVSRGHLVGWKFGTQYISRVSDADNGTGNASDEPRVFSSGGKLIYWSLCCDRESGMFDITIPYGQPNRGWMLQSYDLASNSKAPGYQQMYNDGDSNLYNNMDGWQVYSGKNQSKNGIYGKHGMTQSPPIPYQGKVYLLKGNSLLAFSTTGTNPKTPLPLATIVPTQSLITPPTTANLRQRLENEIQKMIAAGPLRPGHYASAMYEQYGQGGYTDEREFGEIFDYFQNPADTVATLLLAYPYLSSTTQQAVKNYLITYYGPGATNDFTQIAHVGWGNGASREANDLMPLTATLGGWGGADRPPLNPSPQPICPGGCGLYWRNFPPFNFYAAWKYAQIIGNNDPNFAKNIFNSMSSKIEAPPGYPTITAYIIHHPYFLNLYAAGYYGYLQLKQLAGLGTDSTVQNYYNAVLSARVTNFKATYKDTPFWATGNGNSLDNGWDNRALSIARNFMFMTPELGTYMSTYIPSADLQETVNEYNYVGPYWFVTGFDDTIEEGTFQQLYDSPALFQAKAWILKQPYSELVKWLDVPTFATGDLFYIQNLSAALSAGTP